MAAMAHYQQEDLIALGKIVLGKFLPISGKFLPILGKFLPMISVGVF